MGLPWATFLVSNGNNMIACNFSRFVLVANDVNADKLPLETAPVVRDYNTS